MFAAGHTWSITNSSILLPDLRYVKGNPMLAREKMTYHEYAALPNDGKRYELLHGVLVMTPAPMIEHQDVSSILFYYLYHFVKANQFGKVYHAPLDVILDENTVVEPDILFLSTARISLLTKKACEGSPDMVVEIVSPSSITRDRYTKRKLYQQFGVQEYWIADPANKSIEVLILREGQYNVYCIASAEGDEEDANRLVSSAVLEGFSLDVREVFLSKNA